MTATKRRKIRTLAAISFVVGVLLISAGVRANNQRPHAEPTPNPTAISTPTADPQTSVSSDDAPPAAPVDPRPTPDGIRDFDQCAAAGYPIAESYPRQCFADGHGFTEVIE